MACSEEMRLQTGKDKNKWREMKDTKSCRNVNWDGGYPGAGSSNVGKEATKGSDVSINTSRLPAACWCQV